MNNLISKLKAKKDSKKGFTLMEMLIVVAIIAILVAVSIPVFTSQLEKAKLATDLANQRSAKAVAATEYLTNEDYSASTVADAGTTRYYDATEGRLVNAIADAHAAYGKCSKHKHVDGFIKVIIKKDGTIALSWVDKADKALGELDTDIN